jgi:hypothetical protein
MARKKAQSLPPGVLSRTAGFKIEDARYRYEEEFEVPSGRRDAWIEEDLPDGWIAAYRLTADERGLMVIAEVRVFPKEPSALASDELEIEVLHEGEHQSAASQRALGSWSGEPKSVPAGGFRVATLRKMHPAKARTYAFTRSRAIPLPDSFDQLSVKPDKGKRLPRNDRRLAEVAVLYSGACAAGSTSPHDDLAPRLKYSSDYIRCTLVPEARRRGFLTEAPGRGRAGGEATAKALALVARPD